MLQCPPLLPALFCPPSCLPPAPAPYQPLPSRAQRNMFVARGVEEYVSQKEGTQHQNKNHIDLILVFGGQSALSMYVCTLSYSTLRGGRGSRPFTVPKGTDQVFLRYWFGKYQEIPTEYRPKIPNRYTTLHLCENGRHFPFNN